VMVTIEAVEAVVAPNDEQPLSDAEIEELMQPNPKTGAEIAKNPAIGSWADMGIIDSVEWLVEQRRKRREQNQW
ncbi:MAG: hypothetical protein K8F24_05355, partial [Bacteroidales bacterium]|nr:hypothetical protein [Bacteroidales bacterium]